MILTLIPHNPAPSDNKFTMHLRSPGEYFTQGIISGIYGEHNRCHLVPDLKETVYLSEGTDSDIWTKEEWKAPAQARTGPASKGKDCSLLSSVVLSVKEEVGRLHGLETEVPKAERPGCKSPLSCAATIAPFIVIAISQQPLVLVSDFV